MEGALKKKKKDEAVDFKKPFKFQSFTERIANIKIDVIHRVGLTTELPEDRDTFFSEALQKWRELNCTLDFVAFEQQVRNKVDSLAQLVHHKDEIVCRLQEHLQVKDTLAYEPLLDLVVQLARDLQSDFYPEFRVFFPILVSLCSAHNADLIQNAFLTLAYLFKFLWRYMLKDIESVYGMYSELLLQSPKPHIRQFAVESFGFLLRKVRRHDKLFSLVFRSLAEEPELTEGVGQLLFEVCRGVLKQFHSCTEKVLPSLLAKLGEEGLPGELVFQALTKAVQLMAEHTRREFAGPVWGPLLAHVKQLHSRWQEREEQEPGEEQGEPLSWQLAHSLHLVGVMVAWRKGTRVVSGEQVAQTLLDILPEPDLPADALSVALHLGASLLLVSPALPDLEGQPHLLEGIVSKACGRVHGKEVELVLEFFQELVEGHEKFQAVILPDCLSYCNSVAQNEENETAVVNFLCRLCLHFEPRYLDRLGVNTAESVFVLSLEHLATQGRLTRSVKTGPDSQIVAVLMKFMEAGLSVIASWDSPAGGSLEEVETLWAALVCLQYTRPLAESAIHTIRQVYHALKEALHSSVPDSPAPPGSQILPSPPAPCDELVVAMAQSLVTLVSAVGGEELLEAVPLDDVVKILRSHSDSVPLLSAVDRYFTKLSDSQPGSDALSSVQLEKVLPFLQPNLSAPSSAVRLLSLRILCHFEQPSLPVLSQEGLDEDGAVPVVDVLEICLHVEQIPTELDSYRDKLLWLQKLKYRPHSFNQLPLVYREVPLQYLIGMLYVNFSLIWEPVHGTISTFAVEENRQLFWGVFGKFLLMASEISESAEMSPSTPETPPTSDDASSTSWHSCLHALFCLQSAQARWAGLGRPDHAHFRRQLWKCVGKFPGFAEPRSRILVPLLLRFLQSEYAPMEDQLMDFQDLRRRDTTETDLVTADTDTRPETDTSLVKEIDEGVSNGGGSSLRPFVCVGSGSYEGEEEGREEVGTSKGAIEDLPASGSLATRGRSKDRSGRSQSGSRKTSKTLLAMLTVFSKFHNPKAFYKQEELRELYLKLLTHKDTEVQKLSLACLMSYKPPHLLPYRENFERLMDDVSFREELLNFSADSECSVVAEEHREKLLPVLVRLLYGRMQRSAGPNTTKSGGASRRGPVLRFLAGCQGNEMNEFVNLIMLPFQSLLGGHCVVDMSRVIPLKKQQGFLNMVARLLSALGPKAQLLLGRLFPVVLKMASGAAQLLKERDLIQPHSVNALKLLRQLAINRISECFESYTEFDFSPFREEIFNSAVWSQVVRLPQECIQHPTPLMKLLFTWSKFPRYFSLLNQPIPDWVLQSSAGPTPLLHPPQPPSLSSSLLYYVYSCLFSPGVSRSVCGVVMEMAINFLNEEGQEQKMETEQSGSSGYQLVVPFIPQLLRYLSSAIGRGRGKEAGPTVTGGLQMEFSVLSKISVYVQDPSESSLLIQLLLPFLLDTAATEKSWKYEESILHTVCNLVAAVEQVSGFYRILSQQFLVLTARKSRLVLCNVFQKISQKDSHLEATASVVTKLNAWDRKHIEEPDYSTRLDGYSEAKRVLQRPEGWSVDQVLPVLHNAMFFLLKSEDMSVRDAAASFVFDLISHVGEQDIESFQILIMDTIVSGVKQGLRSNHEFARHESVSLLSHLVRTYPSHPRFSDMTTLTHKDPEADFFENIRHIQLHRRTRALRRLATSLTEGSLGSYCTTTFLLPLASQVVFTRLTNVEQNLVAEAINAIGAAAQRLKWSTYCFLLRHYLRQLPKRKDIQKPLIRVVVAILDAFHFDLSSARPLDKEEERGSKHRGLLLGGGPRKGKGALGPSVPATASATETPKDDTVSCEASERVSVDEGKGTGEGKEAKGEGQGDEEAGEGEEEERREEEEEDDKEGGEMDVDEVQRQSTAQRIHRTIVRSILPSLQAVLTKKVGTPAHKLSRTSHNDEEAHILRVPVAMAMTKLLLALPESTLHRHLPSLLLKVCQTLKNRDRDVRDVARNTLVKMATALGPKYLLYILREMKEGLTRGYQLHVLSFSLHTVLAGLVSTLKPGDLDPCLETISQILMEDLFGLPAEEREVGEAIARIPESKTPQSYASYEITAQFLSPKLLPDLLAPVKQILESKSTARVARIVEEVFRRAGLGIHGNEAFTPQALLVLIHNLIRDGVPQLASRPGPKRKPPPSPAGLRPPDSRLLPPTPTRSGPKLSSQGNIAAHLVVQFGLQLLQMALKRGKFDETSEEQLRMLDPFIPLLAESLGSRHIKVLSRSLQCLISLIQMPLPSLGSQIQTVSSHLFEVLKKYARAGAAVVGSNRELVISAFKAMTAIVRDFKQHVISEDELRLLLSFVEEDIYDYQRQSTAFPLLKTILGRKLIVPEVHELMQKVAQLSVTAESENTRLQCRQALLHFIMNYPLGKKLLRYLDFCVTNLSYQEQSGRESIIELLATIFSKFPERLLHRHASYFFVPMASRLVNDESPTCRQMVAEAMKTLLKRLDTERKNDVATIIEVWINKPKLIHKRLAVQTLGLMVETEGTGFEKRLAKFLPLLSKCLQLHELTNSEEDTDTTHSHDGDVGEEREQDPLGAEDDKMQVDSVRNLEEITELVEVAEPHNQMESDGDSTTEWKRPSPGDCNEKDMDHLLFSTLSTLEKICNACTVLRVPVYSELMNELWGRAQSLLLHPHSWVRLATARLYGQLFAAYELEEIISGESKKRRKKGKKAKKEKKTVEYILQDCVLKVQELSSAFCMQLSSPVLNSELANQTVKNLVFLAKVLHRLQIAGKISVAATSSMDESTERDLDADADRRFDTDSRTDGDSEIDTEQQKMEPVKDLNWLINRMSRLARYEAGHHPKESMKRIHVLQWTAAISMDLGQEYLASYLPALLRPIYRELADTDKTAGEALHSMAQEIADMMKGVCGREAFSRAYAEVHQAVVLTRERRRKQAALEAVANPEKSIRRKQKKNLLKKESRKRKIIAYRPTAKKFRHH